MQNEEIVEIFDWTYSDIYTGETEIISERPGTCDAIKNARGQVLKNTKREVSRSLLDGNGLLKKEE